MKKTLLILTAIFTFFVAMILIAGFFVNRMMSTQPVSSNTLLTVSLSQSISEKSNPLAFQPTLSFDRMISSLKKASTDDRIKAVLVIGDSLPASLAQKEEIRNMLSLLVEKNKTVYVYFDYADMGSYVVVPKGAKVISHDIPGGYFYLKGYYSAQLFMRTLLEEKLGVKMNVIHIGEYKGSGETFSRDTMSEYLREELTQFIDDLWSNLMTAIPESRNIDSNVFEEKLFNGDYFAMSQADALENQLIDSFENKFALEDNYDSVIHIGDYATDHSLSPFSKAPIALIVAEGEIVTGEETLSPFNNKSVVASDTLCRTIRDAASDSSIKAIVLRINSPGGSALASELIYRELKQAAEKKPLIASIGGMGASGGFYIACGCDTILADKSSLVGSIGVVSMIPEFTQLFDKAGINVQTIQKGKYSSFITPYEELDDDNKAVLTQSMKDIYKIFKSRVAGSRNMTADQVEEIAKGRIYSGRRGLELGLVDSIGGLEEALHLAAEKAGLSSVSYRRFDKKVSIFTFLNKKASISMELPDLMPFTNVNRPAVISPAASVAQDVISGK